MSENIVSFFELVADSSSFSGAFLKAKKDSMEFAGAFKVAATSVEADASKMGAALQRGIATGAVSRASANEMIAQRLRFYGGGAGSGAAAGAAGGGGGLGLSGGLGGLLATVGLVTVVLGPLAMLGAAFIRDEANLASFSAGILRNSEAIGINAQDLQTWDKIAEKVGLDGDSMTQMFGRFGKNLAEGAPALKATGFTLKDLGITSTNVGRAILQLSDWFHRNADEAQKLAVAQALFGRGGTALVPILNQGSQAFRNYRDELQKMGVLLSNSDLVMGARAQAAISQLSEAFEGAKNRLLAAALPGFTAFFQYLSGLMENNGALWTQIGNLISEDISFIIGVLSGLTGQQVDLTKSSKDAGAAYEGLGGAANDAADGINGTADAAQRASKALDDEIAKLQDAKRVQDNLYDAQKQALQDQLDHVTAVNDSRRQQGEDLVSYERRLEEQGIQDKIKGVDKAKNAYDNQVEAHIASLEKEKRAVSAAGSAMGASLASGIGSGMKAGAAAGNSAAIQINQRFVKLGQDLGEWLKDFFNHPKESIKEAAVSFGNTLGSAFVQGIKNEIATELHLGDAGSAQGRANAAAAAHPPKKAYGGFVSEGIFHLHDNELVLPLSNPGRTAQLLGQAGLVGGGGGITVIFNGPVADEMVAKRVITKIDREMRKRGFNNGRSFGTG
jgi:hypothetical protein